MKPLLKCIYSGPRQLLEKAKLDEQSLRKALEQGDESSVRENLFNLVVTTYHIVDWVKSYHSDLKNEVYTHLESCEALRACRDLCNASKHVQISLEHRAYQQHPPVVEEVVVSATVATVLSPLSSPSWRLKVQLTSGQRLPAEDLAHKAIGAWEEFFLKHNI
ncbi:MAG: hypothetical protein MN733_08340 [Nitrososphaera sp.]|nr:hypothetical protein [Nitrososphaera sp.]